MVETRKIITLREIIFSELGVEAAPPITRAVGMAVIRNRFAGKFVEYLRPLFEAGAMLGKRPMPDLVKLLHGPAGSYGKGAIVGVAGEMEDGGACVHPMLGKPMRAAVGGGKAVIGSNVKVAAADAVLTRSKVHSVGRWSKPSAIPSRRMRRLPFGWSKSIHGNALRSRSPSSRIARSSGRGLGCSVEPAPTNPQGCARDDGGR